MRSRNHEVTTLIEGHDSMTKVKDKIPSLTCLFIHFHYENKTHQRGYIIRLPLAYLSPVAIKSKMILILIIIIINILFIIFIIARLPGTDI